MANGYVYLICDLGKDNAYKIGVTKNIVEERKKELQTGNSSELHICNYYQTEFPYKIETMLHHRYNSKNIKNEWFELTDEEALNFKKECEKCEKIIEALKDNPFF